MYSLASQSSAAEPTHFTLDQCATFWQVSKKTVRTWMDAGKIEVVYLGRLPRIAREERDRIGREGFSL